MNKERLEIEVGVGMDDSDLISYTYLAEEFKLVVQIQAWDARMIKISFLHPMMFIFRGNHSLCLFCELLSQSSILDEALSLAYEVRPKDYPYKVYQLIDIEDVVALEVVCENYDVVVEERKK